ncbi:MAG TPA: HAMP domain-containing sensor histidine kinase [Polyangiaceae bacterium]|nr:HAMP domain-containing sensor histidine kinase [Polyangiaceae bacterium]
MAEPSDKAFRAVLEATRRIVGTSSLDEALAHCATSARTLLGAAIAIVSLDEAPDSSAPPAPVVSKDPSSEALDVRTLQWLEKDIRGESGARLGSLRVGAPPGVTFEGMLAVGDGGVVADLAEAVAIAIRNAARLQAASEALLQREDILAIVAHDLRNPLNTISMSLALLRQDATPRDTPQLDRIGRAMHRMNRLVGDLLDASALDQGRLRVTLRPELAAGIVREAADAAALAARASGSRIAHDLPEPDVRIAADRDRLIQVLSAIVANALKFSPEGSQVRLAVSRQGDFAVFAVADQGPGIDPAHAQRIFERHYKANPASRDGVGLGLFIARGIVEGHRGTMRIESEPGRGTIVSVAIPLAL